jgi:hypothetical protein
MYHSTRLNGTDAVEYFTILSLHLAPPLLPLLRSDRVYNGGIVSTSACSCLKATDQIDFSAASINW